MVRPCAREFGRRDHLHRLVPAFLIPNGCGPQVDQRRHASALPLAQERPCFLHHGVDFARRRPSSSSARGSSPATRDARFPRIGTSSPRRTAVFHRQIVQIALARQQDQDLLLDGRAGTEAASKSRSAACRGSNWPWRNLSSSEPKLREAARSRYWPAPDAACPPPGAWLDLGAAAHSAHRQAALMPDDIRVEQVASR